MNDTDLRRPRLPGGLAVAGAAWVRRVIETLPSEFDNLLALTGCPVAAALDPSFVTAAPWARR